MQRRWPFVILAVAVLAATFAGCGGDDGTGDTSPSPAPPTSIGTAAANPSGTPAATTPPARTTAAATTVASTVTGAACSTLPAGLEKGRTAVLTLTSDGRQRSYRLRVPANVDPAKPAPLILNFHGLGSSGIEQEVYSGLVPLSDRDGFYLVSADGTGEPRAWNILNLAILPDDDQFVRDLLDALEAKLCLDDTRIYATGMSNGAFFSSQLACRLGDRIAAIAPVAGVRKPGPGCAGGSPVLAFHGMGDGVVPFEAGRVLSLIDYDGARAEVGAWAKQNGCGPTPTSTRIAEHVVRESYAGCVNGNDTVLVVVEDGGHTWPGAIAVAALGRTNREISAAELIWAFFQAHLLR